MRDLPSRQTQKQMKKKQSEIAGKICRHTDDIADVINVTKHMHSLWNIVRRCCRLAVTSLVTPSTWKAFSVNDLHVVCPFVILELYWILKKIEK